MLNKQEQLLTKLYRIILPVTDIEVAQNFYAQVLQQNGTRVSPGRHYFDLGGTILACYDPVADGDDLGQWQFHDNQYLYFSVPYLQDLWNRVNKAKHTALGPIETMPWGETLFYANDPFGNPICFVDEKTVFTGN